MCDPNTDRSQPGYVFTSFIKQTVSATSSNHTKILAIHEASWKYVWLRSVIQHIRESCDIFLGQEAPTIVHEDNVACVAQLKDGYIKGDKTKHILPKFLFTHDLKKCSDVIVQKVRSSDNQADLFTKALPTTTFKKLVHDTEMRRLNESDLIVKGRIYARIRKERSSDNGVCGSSSLFVSSVSGPCKPLLSGGYRSPQSNCSVGGKVVVLDFGNSEVRLESYESFFGVNHSEGSPHCAYEFPSDSPFSGSYIRSGPTVLDFENCLTRSVGAGNELRRTDAHKSTPLNVRWGQPQAQTDTVPFDNCIDRRGLDVIRNKKTKAYEVKRDSNFLRPHYHRCCGGEKVVCKWPHEPPAGIKEVFKYKGFQENMRAYNQMCAMTSFGACIDDSVNRRDPSQLDPEFVSTFIRLLDEHNELVRLFRTARDRVESGHILEFHIRLFSVVGAREYDLPTSGTLGAIVFENGPNARIDYDVIIESRGGFPQRVNKLHPSYMSLQFPLLFVYGEPGFYPLRQNDIRREYLSGVHDAISKGDREGSQVGVRLILPRTFTGGPRYMYSHYLDALAICRVLELPDPTTDPQGYRVVSEMMVHGPCGLLHSDADCMKEGKCGKNFPKKFIAHTFFDADRYVHYRRKETHTCASRRGVDLDNGYIMPYNRQLCLAFHAHINVEYCGWSMLIKYLFKYISKGTDKIAAKIVRQVGDPPADSNNGSIQIDEIQNYTNGSFVFPHEACWRILKYDIHGRQPAVQILYVHLEGMQPVTFRDHQPLTLIVNNEGKMKTTLTEWLEYNKRNGYALHLTYIYFTKEFVWYSDTKSCRRRQRRNSGLIGRLANVHPTSGELFFLRMLLCHQKGCKTFDDIRTVNKQLYLTFRAACEALGLLGDDKEWYTELEEVAFSASSQQLRSIFVQILIFCDVADPMRLWKSFWRRMSDDVPRTVSNSLHIQDLYMNDPELEGSVLYEVEVILKNYSKTIADFRLPPLSLKSRDALKNRELMEEKSYNKAELAKEVAISVPKLNPDKKAIYDMVLRAANENKQEMIFVYGHGGTGKTFLWRTLINSMRSKGKIVLVVASSRIASLLLPAGHTAHSRFKLPLDLTDESLCNIKKNTNVASLLAETSLIIWDESPMNDRRCFEALDRTLRDVLDAPEKLFGDKTIVLGGDFRQTLPVKKGASKPEIVSASIAASELWPHFKVYKLTENMRPLQLGLNKYEKTRAATFASWLLELGDGFMYNENTLQHPTASDLQQKAIVCPKNTTVDEINETVLEMLHGKSMVYTSSDEAIPVGSDCGEVELLYPPEYLNTLQFLGFPSHRLELKVGAPIMLL
nr:DNA helicase [Tanacetum cinerariifolium]